MPVQLPAVPLVSPGPPTPWKTSTWPPPRGAVHSVPSIPSPERKQPSESPPPVRSAMRGKSPCSWPVGRWLLLASTGLSVHAVIEGRKTSRRRLPIWTTKGTCVVAGTPLRMKCPFVSVVVAARYFPIGAPQAPARVRADRDRRDRSVCIIGDQRPSRRTGESTRPGRRRSRSAWWCIRAARSNRACRPRTTPIRPASWRPSSWRPAPRPSSRRRRPASPTRHPDDDPALLPLDPELAPLDPELPPLEPELPAPAGHPVHAP